MATGGGPPGLIDPTVLQRHAQYYGEVFQGGDGSWAQDPQSILRRSNDQTVLLHALLGFMESQIAMDTHSIVQTLSTDVANIVSHQQSIFGGMKAFEDRLKALEDASTGTRAPPPHAARTFPLLESKCIANMKPFKEDRSEYRT